MARATLPLDPAAVKAADAKLGVGRPLSPTDPADATLRKQWMQAYAEAGGKVNTGPPAPKPVGSPACNCPNAKIKSPESKLPAKQTEKPCDFTSVTLTATPARPAVHYRYVRGQGFIEVQNQSNPRTITVGPSAGGAEQPRFLEIVAGAANGRDRPTQLQVDVAAGPGYHDSAVHPAIRINSDAASRTYAGVTAVSACRIPVYSQEPSPDRRPAGMAEFFERYWCLAITPNVYAIDADVCGIRLDGSRPVGQQYVALNVYPSDQYTLKIKVPPYQRTVSSRESAVTLTGSLDKRSESFEEFTSAGGRKTSTSIEAEESATGWSEKQTRSSTLLNGAQFATERETAAEDGEVTRGDPVLIDDKPPEVGIEFAINGVHNSVTQALEEAIQLCKKLEKDAKEVWNSIKDWVPQVGWKFDLDVSILSGEIALTWGYKEHADHRVIGRTACVIAIDVVKIVAEVSFGVRIGKFLTALLMGKADDGLRLEVERSNEQPESDEPVKLVEVSKAIDFDLSGVVATGGPEWLQFRRQAGLRWGVDVQASIARNSKGWALPYKVYWRPVQAYVIRRNWFTADVPAYYQWTEGKLDEGDFFNPDKSAKTPREREIQESDAHKRADTFVLEK